MVVEVKGRYVLSWYNVGGSVPVLDVEVSREVQILDELVLQTALERRKEVGEERNDSKGCDAEEVVQAKLSLMLS